MSFHAALLPLLEGNNVILFIILIVLFVVAYRLLQAVINTAIVAVLSGVFLVALDFVGIGPGVTVNRFILFMVLGTGLFILFSTMATVARTSSTLYGASKKLIQMVIAPFRWISGLFRKIGGLIGGDDGGGRRKERNIVLEEVDDE